MTRRSIAWTSQRLQRASNRIVQSIIPGGSRTSLGLEQSMQRWSALGLSMWSTKAWLLQCLLASQWNGQHHFPRVGPANQRRILTWEASGGLRFMWGSRFQQTGLGLVQIIRYHRHLPPPAPSHPNRHYYRRHHLPPPTRSIVILVFIFIIVILILDVFINLELDGDQDKPDIVKLNDNLSRKLWRSRDGESAPDWPCPDPVSKQQLGITRRDCSRRRVKSALAQNPEAHIGALLGLWPLRLEMGTWSKDELLEAVQEDADNTPWHWQIWHCRMVFFAGYVTVLSACYWPCWSLCCGRMVGCGRISFHQAAVWTAHACLAATSIIFGIAAASWLYWRVEWWIGLLKLNAAVGLFMVAWNLFLELHSKQEYAKAWKWDLEAVSRQRRASSTTRQQNDENDSRNEGQQLRRQRHLLPMPAPKLTITRKLPMLSLILILAFQDL